jgi:hypothetical protein
MSPDNIPKAACESQDTEMAYYNKLATTFEHERTYTSLFSTNIPFIYWISLHLTTVTTPLTTINKVVSKWYSLSPSSLVCKQKFKKNTPFKEIDKVH